MVICKYFLSGTCRFGDSCRNEHTYNNQQSLLRKKPDVDINVIVKAVNDDVENADKSGQWPLSCYGPFQGKPCVPGIEDLSFEEVRKETYEAQEKGTLEQYKQQLMLLIQENKRKMKALQFPPPEIRNLLQQLYNVVPESSYGQTNTFNTSGQSIFSQTPFNAAPQQSIFNNTPPQAPKPSIFSNAQPSIFANAQPTQLASIFSNSPANNFSFTQPEGSTFSNPSTNLFSNFNQTNQVSGSIFANANPVQSNTNIFSNAAAQPSFNQNYTTGNIFQNASNQQNMFANPQPEVTAQSSIFANAQPSLFNSPSAFSNPQPSIFANQQFNSPQPSLNKPFGQPPPYVPPATQTDGAQQNPAPPQNIFGVQSTNSPLNIFGGNQSAFSAPKLKDDPCVYSKLEDLNNNDIQSFEAPKFEFGKIPELPPTLQMC